MTEDEASAGCNQSRAHVADRQREWHRGQTDAVTVLKGVTLGIIVIPIAIAAGKIQSQLAALSGFSWLVASLITLLLIATGLAAALEEV